MKKIYLLSTLFLATLFFISCDKDDDNDDDMDMHQEFEYHAHIHSPNSDDKHIGDTIHIHVEFESHTGQTVHHVKVRIYDISDSTEVYNLPTDAHVHATTGTYEHHDHFILSNANGIEEHGDYKLEAKVWGHAAGEEEVIETIQLHVHP